MPVELIRTTTSDGLRLDGALHGPASDRPAIALDALIALHGVGGNFYNSALFERLLPPLRLLGVPIALVNTRGRDGFFTSGNRKLGAAYEIVDECRLDIAAWIEFFSKRGAARIGLLGHSLGAIKVLYSQAFQPHDAFRGVIALSPPRLSFAAFQQGLDSPRFFESYATAKSLAEKNRGDELFEAKFPFPLLISAATFLDKYGPGERYNILRFSGAIDRPLLFTFGSRELESGGIAFAGLDDAVNSLPANPHGRQVLTIADADHQYTGVQPALAEQISQWLREKFPLTAGA